MPQQETKFLVTDNVPSGFMEGLGELGFKCDHIQKLGNDEMFEIIDQYTGLVVNTSLLINKRVLDKAVGLKYILRPGSGLDNIDIGYAQAKGIKVFSSPEANADAVAEHAIGMLLGLMNFIPRALEEVKQLKWIRERNKGTLLKGKTVGVIGYGHTGAAFAKKLSGFEAKILVYDKYKSGFGNDFVQECAMEDIYHQADIVSLHIPLTGETEHLVSDEFINRFQKPFYLLNTSRGKNVNLATVIQGLGTGKLYGAAMDVLENEKIDQYTEKERQQLAELFGSGNVIVTPHIAGWTTESRNGIFMVVLEKLKKYLMANVND